MRVEREATTFVDVLVEAVLTRSPEPPTRDRRDLMRQPTVWAQPPRPPRLPLARRVAELVRAAGSLLTVALWLVGIPAALVVFVGWPLPRTMPNGDDLLRTFGRADLLTPDMVVNGAAVVVWLIWAVAVFFFVYVLASRARIRLPRLPAPRLVQQLVTGLVGSVTVTATAHSAAAAPPAATAAADPAPQQASTDDIDRAGAGAVSSVRTVPAAAIEAAGSGGAPMAYQLGGRGPMLASHTVASSRAAAALPVYEVRDGDWLGSIAQRYLGSFDRYGEIQRLNPGLVSDADHIEPGWRLVLPADAHDHGTRRHAIGRLQAVPPAAIPDAPGAPGGGDPGSGATPAEQGESPATPSASAAPPSSTTTPTPPMPPTTAATTEPGAAASPTPPGSSTATPPTGDPAKSAEPTAAPDAREQDAGIGVSLPGGWIGLPFAVALVAAGAMVWLRRRHRYVPLPRNRPTDDEPDLRALPPVMNRIRRAVRRQAPAAFDPLAGVSPTVAEYVAAPADQRPELPAVGPSGPDLAGVGARIPVGGLGLAGPGAGSAARALMVATLSSGSPADPDAKGLAIIPADTLATLLAGNADVVGEIPRVLVAADLSEALTRLDELVLERRRLLDDYAAVDVTDLRAVDAFHPPMPPVLLLADSPSTGLHARLTTTLHLGAPLQIAGVLLGEWPDGNTLTVGVDGRTDDDGDRLAVLDIATTVDLLQVLREAHTGLPVAASGGADDGMDPTARDTAGGDHIGADQPPAATPPPSSTRPPAPTATPPASDQPSPDQDQPTPAGPAAAPAAVEPAAVEGTAPGSASPGDRRAGIRSPRRPVPIHLLGNPVIFDRDDNPVPGLRHHARELLVYLTVHRNGADLSQIMEAFWPTATVRRASERLSTEAGDLRRRIRQAAGDKTIQPVVNTGGRYHLDPNLVDIDAWRHIDALRQATTATDPQARAVLLRQAVDAHTGILAEGYNYDWIEQPREHLRRHGIRARLRLAELVAATDPATAADLLRAAAGLDPINEELAQRAMRASARVGDAAGISALLQQLRTALDGIDEEPSRDTIALASDLQGHIPPPQPPDTP